MLESVGSTPLVQLSRFLESRNVKLLAKMESFNPGGSAKDRPALAMIEGAFAAGKIDRDSTIVESSSGNMGIGLAQACRFFDLDFVCVVDPHAQSQNVAIMEALGARIERVRKPHDGSYLAARWNRVAALLNEIEGSFWPNQYANELNPHSHEVGTIREIDETLGGDFDYLFVATSSTGTARGCRDYLRKRGRRAKVIAVDAVGSRLFGGEAGARKIPGLGAGTVPKLAVGQKFDQVVRVSDLDCVVGCRRASKREAILVGGSAGGVLMSVEKMSHALAGKMCVAILHDSGTRYLDTVFSDQWVLDELGQTRDQIDHLVDCNGPQASKSNCSSVTQFARSMQRTTLEMS